MIEFSYRETAHISDKKIKELAKKLQPIIDEMKAARADGYDSQYASLECPYDEHQVAMIKQLVSKKRRLRPSLLVVIGIGGSNLGTKAILNILGVKGFDVMFADTVDPDKLHLIMMEMDHRLEHGKEVMLNVVSKSGTTTETIANFKVLYSLLKTYRPNNYRDYVVVTTDEGSPLAEVAEEDKLDLITVPKQVGGRYSIFSAVGLFPLLLARIDVEHLMFGARTVIEQTLTEQDAPAIVSASLLYEYIQKEYRVHDFFMFVARFEVLGKWYRQLMGESIGKNEQVGMLPTVSMGSTDLHSVGQLYLAGPRTMFTSFVTTREFSHHVKVPSTLMMDLVPMISGKYLTEIMGAVANGTKAAYADRENPFCSYTFTAINAESVGMFMQIQMLQMMLLGKLLGVNPFDQPEVERYKEQTRKLLS